MRRIKVAKLIPTEAILVSLVGRPSARSSKLTEEELVRCAEGHDDLVAAVLRGDEPPETGDGMVTQAFQCEIRRLDKDSRTLYAQVYNAPWDPDDGAQVTREEFDRHVDTYRTYMDHDGLRWLAHRFMEVGRGIDVNHDQKPGKATVVESFVAREQWQPWEAGAWVMGVRVDDEEILKRVELGQSEETRSDPQALTGFSIHILARREERTIEIEGDEESREDAETRIKRSLWQRMGEMLGLASASPETPADEEIRGISTDFASAWSQVEVELADGKLASVLWTLRNVLSNIASVDAVSDKPSAVARAFDGAKAQFLTLAATQRSEAAAGWELDSALHVEERIGKKISAARLAKLRAAVVALESVLADVDDNDENREEIDMTVDELRTLITSAMEPVTSRLDNLDGRLGAVESRGDETNEQEQDSALTASQFGEVVRDAVAPVTERLDKLSVRLKRVEGTSPPRQAADEVDEGDEALRAERSEWAGIVQWGN